MTATLDAPTTGAWNLNTEPNHHNNLIGRATAGKTAVSTPRVAATGTARRIQGMRYMGFSYDEMRRAIIERADRLGIGPVPGSHPLLLAEIATGQQTTVHPVLARVMRIVSGDYSGYQKGPDEAANTEARRFAKSMGWHSIMVWDNPDDPNDRPMFDADPDFEDYEPVEENGHMVPDMVSVARVRSGSPQDDMREADRFAAVALYSANDDDDTASGMTARELSQAIGLTERNVVRYRTWLGGIPTGEYKPPRPGQAEHTYSQNLRRWRLVNQAYWWAQDVQARKDWRDRYRGFEVPRDERPGMDQLALIPDPRLAG